MLLFELKDSPNAYTGIVFCLYTVSLHILACPPFALIVLTPLLRVYYNLCPRQFPVAYNYVGGESLGGVQAEPSYIIR